MFSKSVKSKTEARKRRHINLLEGLEMRTMLSGPLVITSGGTYTGTWESTDRSVPAVKINTTQPVIIENSIVRGPGYLIASGVDHTNITVRNTQGFGVNPNIYGKSVKRFFNAERFDNVVLENNYMENTAGIYFLNYVGNHSSNNTIKVVGNTAKNIDGRRSDGNGGYLDFNTRIRKSDGVEEDGMDLVQFVQFDKVQGVPDMEIAWNEVINEPGNSRVEDNINVYKSSGTSASPMLIHDNYIQGAYTIKPWQGDTSDAVYDYDWSFSGGGILLGDGVGANPAQDPSFIKAYGNTIVSTTNYGIAIAAGHDNEFYDNRIVSAGRTPDGTLIVNQNVGGYVWDSYHGGATHFFNNNGHDNLIGWVQGNGRNDWWTPVAANMTNNTHWSGTITLGTEATEHAAWTARNEARQSPPPPPPSDIPISDPVQTPSPPPTPPPAPDTTPTPPSPPPPPAPVSPPPPPPIETPQPVDPTPVVSPPKPVDPPPVVTPPPVTTPVEPTPPTPVDPPPVDTTPTPVDPVVPPPVVVPPTPPVDVTPPPIVVTPPPVDVTPPPVVTPPVVVTPPPIEVTPPPVVTPPPKPPVDPVGPPPVVVIPPPPVDIDAPIDPIPFPVDPTPVPVPVPVDTTPNPVDPIPFPVDPAPVVVVDPPPTAPVDPIPFPVVEIPVVVSGVVFNDRDADGKRDSGESGVAGQVVWADLNNDGTQDSNEPATTSDVKGVYTLTLLPGSYKLRQAVPAGSYETSGPATFNLTGNGLVSSFNFGLAKYGEISGTVFRDSDRDKRIDASESGLAGVTVFIDTNNNGWVDRNERRTVTDENGDWSFDHLTAGVYTVRVSLNRGRTSPSYYKHRILSGSAFTEDNFGYR